MESLLRKSVWFARSLLHLESLGGVFALLCWLCPIRSVISILWTTRVSQLFLFSSFPCVCQVLCTCQSFHAFMLVLIGFLLVAALGQTSCSAQQLFRKRKILKIFLLGAWLPTFLEKIYPLAPPSLWILTAVTAGASESCFADVGILLPSWPLLGMWSIYLLGIDPVAPAEPLLPHWKVFEPCWIPAFMSFPSNHKCWMKLGVPQCIECFLSFCSLQRSRFMWPVEQICYLWEEEAAGPN